MFASLGPPDQRMLEDFITRDPVTGHFVCRTCGKSQKHKHSLKSHVETIHLAGMFSYSCTMCGKTYNGKNSLDKHMSLIHREMK